MKNRLNQDVAHYKKTQKNIRFWRKVWRGKLNLSWRFQTNLDMISKLNSKSEQI